MPEFVSSSSQEMNWTVGEKDRFLMCEYSGIPDPEVTWYYNNVPIDGESSDRYSIHNTLSSASGTVYKTIVSKLLFKGKTWYLKRNIIEKTICLTKIVTWFHF